MTACDVAACYAIATDALTYRGHERVTCAIHAAAMRAARGTIPATRFGSATACTCGHVFGSQELRSSSSRGDRCLVCAPTMWRMGDGSIVEMWPKVSLNHRGRCPQAGVRCEPTGRGHVHWCPND